MVLCGVCVFVNSVCVWERMSVWMPKRHIFNVTPLSIAFILYFNTFSLPVTFYNPLSFLVVRCLCCTATMYLNGILSNAINITSGISILTTLHTSRKSPDQTIRLLTASHSFRFCETTYKITINSWLLWLMGWLHWLNFVEIVSTTIDFLSLQIWKKKYTKHMNMPKESHISEQMYLKM